MFGIIYGIENMINHKIYVGQTKQPLEERFKGHKKSDMAIGKAIRKYGAENFVKVILEECETQTQLNEREIFWIAKLNCMAPDGYNFTAGGEGVRNFHHTSETCKQISATMTGRKQTEEHKKNSSISQKKRWQNPEEHKKATLGQLKRYENPDEHKKTSEALKKSRRENPISTESRAKQAESLTKFYVDNPEMKKHLSEMTKKQFATPEARKRHSEIMKKYYAEKRAKTEKTVNISAE